MLYLSEVSLLLMVVFGLMVWLVCLGVSMGVGAAVFGRWTQGVWLYLSLSVAWLRRLNLDASCASRRYFPVLLMALPTSFCLLMGGDLHGQGLQRSLPQPDGVVRALAASGDTLLIGGDFRSISMPGRASNYLGMYDTLTRLVSGGRPMPDGPVNAVLGDGGNGLLVAGQFRSIGDSACYSIAWLDSNGVPRPALRNFGVSGQVNSLARIGDTLYLGGDFTQAGSNLLFTGGFPEFDSSGALLRRLPRPNFPAKVLLSDGQGGWIIGGPFTSVDGQARQGLARIRPDGKLLDGWAPAIQGEARTLLVVGDTLFVGGTIAALNGQARGNLAAVRLSTGVPINWAPLCNRPVEALAFGNNLLVVGGNFTQVDNSQRGRLAAFNFPSLLPSGLGTSLDSTVRVLRFFQGFLYLGGDFNTAAGLPRRGLAVFDQNFLFPTTANAQLNGSVRSLSIDALGRLTVGGSFTQAGSQARTCLARFDGPQLALLPWNVSLSGRVDWVGDWRGKVMVSGALDSLQGQPLGTALLALDTGSAQLDSTLLNLPAAPSALAVAGGNLAYQGSAAFNGGEKVSHLAAVDLISGQMLPWKPQADLPVNTLLAVGPRLFAGGRFVRISMFLSRGLAELNPVTGQVVPGMPTPNGEVRTLAAFDSLLLVGGNFSSIGNQVRSHFGAIHRGSKTLNSISLTLDAGVSALHVDVSGNLYLGGKFSLVNGQNRRGLARISLANGQLSAFSLPLSGGSEILAFAEDSVRLYLGGDFLAVNNSVRPFLAAIRKQTAGLETNMLMATAAVRALTWCNGQLAVAGDALAIGSEVRPGIAAISVSSGLVLPWMPQAEEWVGFGVNGSVRRIEALLVSGNRVLVGGNFNLSSPISAQHFTAFDLTTGQAANALPQFSGEVRGLSFHNGLIWVAGNFNSLNYQGIPSSRSGIAALNPGNLSPNSWTGAGFPAQLLSVKPLNATEVMVAGSTVGAFNTGSGAYRSYGFLGGVGRKVEVSGAAVIVGGLFSGSSRFGLQMKLAPNQQNLSVMDLGPAPVLNPLNEGVYALELANGLVYAGGLFGQVNGQVQANLAAFNLVNGGQVAYNPVPDSAVLSLLFHQNVLYCGGRFSRIFGQNAPRLAALRTAFPVSQQVVAEEVGLQQVWPNPTRRRLFWNRLDSVDGQAVVNLFDMQGRLVASSTYGQMCLELPSLNAGLYLLRIEGVELRCFKVMVE